MISKPCIIFSTVLLGLIILFGSPASQAKEHTESIVITKQFFDTEGLDPVVSWTMEMVTEGIKCSLQVSFEKPEGLVKMTGELGWEYRFDVDSIMVLQGFQTASNTVIKEIVPLEKLIDGKHIISLTVRDLEGKLHIQKREFELDSTPKIKVLSFYDGQLEVFDPKILFTFLGSRDVFVGMVELYLDAQLLKTVDVFKVQNRSPIYLSKLMGSYIYSADLTPGNHLLTITATGVNGSSSSQILPVSGNSSLPGVKVYRTDDGKFETVEIEFPASSKKVVGSAEVHLNRSILLAMRTDQTRLSISRTEILNALSKYEQAIGEDPVTMIISTRSANQVENWQQISFK